MAGRGTRLSKGPEVGGRLGQHWASLDGARDQLLAGSVDYSEMWATSSDEDDLRVGGGGKRV
jgi:hypothetical protein